jgi:hypothetical protein
VLQRIRLSARARFHPLLYERPPEIRTAVAKLFQLTPTKALLLRKLRLRLPTVSPVIPELLRRRQHMWQLLLRRLLLLGTPTLSVKSTRLWACRRFSQPPTPFTQQVGRRPRLLLVARFLQAHWKARKAMMRPWTTLTNTAIATWKLIRLRPPLAGFKARVFISKRLPKSLSSAKPLRPLLKLRIPFRCRPPGVATTTAGARLVCCAREQKQP